MSKSFHQNIQFINQLFTHFQCVKFLLIPKRSYLSIIIKKLFLEVRLCENLQCLIALAEIVDGILVTIKKGLVHIKILLDQINIIHYRLIFKTQIFTKFTNIIFQFLRFIFDVSNCIIYFFVEHFQFRFKVLLSFFTFLFILI